MFNLPESTSKRPSKLVFVRHGESQANLQRIISNRDLHHPLTPEGVEQARGLAQQLKTHAFHRLYSSPILRARETAALLAGTAKQPVILHDGLREPDCGVLEGLGTTEVWAEQHRVVAAWHGGAHHTCPDGGESLEDVRRRFMDFMRLLEDGSHAGMDVLIVTHGMLLGMLLPEITQNLTLDFTRIHPARHTSPIELIPVAENAAYTCIRWCEDQLH